VSERQDGRKTDAAPGPPSAAAVNTAWPARPEARAGVRRLLEGLIERLLGPRFEAQRAFNAAQVRLDNELLAHLGARLAATHRHYDRLLSEQTRRQDEIDERHRLLERELVQHVQDLVARIDLVLAEANRDKLALRFALEDVRARLGRLEEALRRV
jgi:hypothetical protein